MLVQKSLKTHRTELFILLLASSLQFDIDSFSFIPFYLSFSFGCAGIQLRCLLTAVILWETVLSFLFKLFIPSGNSYGVSALSWHWARYL